MFEMFPFQYQFMLKNPRDIHPAPVQYIEKNQNLLFLFTNLKQSFLDTQVPNLVSIHRFDPQIKNPIVLTVLTVATPASGTNFSHLYLNILPLSTVRMYSKGYTSIQIRKVGEQGKQ